MIALLLKAILFALLRILFIIVFCVSGLFYFFGETTIGLQTFIQIVSPFIPGKLHIDHATGKLFSDFTLSNVSYRNTTTNVVLDSIHLAWRPYALFSHQLQIDSLNVIHTQIHVMPATKPSKTHFSVDSLKALTSIFANHVNIQDLAITYNQKPAIQFQSIALQKITSNNTIIAIKMLNGEISGNINDNWHLQWHVNIPNINTFIPKSTGNIISVGNITGPLMTPTIKTDMRATELTLHDHKIRRLICNLDFTFKPDTLSVLRFQVLGIQSHDHLLKKLDLAITEKTSVNKTHVLSTFEIAIANQRYIQVALSLPKTITTNNYLTESISALIQIRFPNFNTLKNYFTGITNPQGTVQGTLQLQGNLMRPTINGEVRLSNASLTIPKLGIHLRNASMRLAGNQSRHITYRGTLQSGDGLATIEGNTDLTQTNFPTEIHIHGNNLEVVNLPEYKIIATPDLKLHLTKLNLKIDGKITIPKAEIIPKDFRQTITLPDDVVIVGAKPTTANILLASMPTMQLSVTLNNNVFIHYQDLTTTLGGNLQVSTGPNNPATAIGTLKSVSGSYHAYGQDLTIKQGQLIYTGGILTNPGLNIKAVRDINTVATASTGTAQTYAGSQVLTVGVQIIGTMDKPIITLFSQPSGLGQDDILSYLLLGIPRSQASIKDSLAILNATSALNIGSGATSQFTSFTKKLQSGLGLTELNVESVQTFNPTANNNMGGVVGTTSLVLGKKIATNLYLHYSVSLFSATPVTVLNLRYQFSKHWSVQSETSTIDNGADLLYSLEHN